MSRYFKFNLSQWTVLSISLFLVALIGWSFWAELEQVSRAPGQVIPTGRVQIIQSSDGGVIADIKVRERETRSRRARSLFCWTR